MDLRDRTVECGACEHRFRIGDDVIVRSKKFYPGERVDALSNRYHRIPITAPVPEGLQTAQYSTVADASAFEPISPQRLIAGVAGGIGVTLMALLLFFGAKNGASLDGMPTSSRLAMAGFSAVFAAVAFVYANPKTRAKAILASGLCALLLLVIPLFRTEGAGSGPQAGNEAAGRGRVNPPVQSADALELLRATIGTDPLTTEAALLAEQGGQKHAYGLWLRGLGDGDKLLVRDYLVRTVAADPTSRGYPRGPGEVLMVVSGVTVTLDQLAERVAPVGEVVAIHREIDVIEVRVNPANFETSPIEELWDRGGPAFYELNKRELESIDLERVKGAVERLADAEPTIFRSDIALRLVGLLSEEGVDFKAQVCDALLVWRDGTAAVGDAAETLLAKLDATKAIIPAELIGLLVKEKRVTIFPTLERLWLEDVSKWERYLIELGPPVEAKLIAKFSQLSGNFRGSAVHVLGKVGGSDSLELLKSAREGAGQELLVRIETAEKEIHQRLGQ